MIDRADSRPANRLYLSVKFLPAAKVKLFAIVKFALRQVKLSCGQRMEQRNGIEIF